MPYRYWWWVETLSHGRFEEWSPILVHAVSARGYDAYFDKPYYSIYKDEESFEKGLVKTLEYLKSHNCSSCTINSDYYKYFGYTSGKERFYEAITSDSK